MTRARAKPPAILVAFGMFYLVVQFAVPLLRLRRDRSFPFASRFSWSMFAAPPAGVCSHAIEWRARDGTREPFPLPPRTHAAWEILSARTVSEFSNAAWVLSRYPDSDAEVASYLDDLLERYRTEIDASHAHTLISTLDCHSDESAPPFHRVLRLGAAP